MLVSPQTGKGQMIGEETGNKVRGAQSIYRTVDILRILLNFPEGCLAREISERAQLPFSTTHRLLTVLCEKGLIYQDKESRLYYPSLIWSSCSLWQLPKILHRKYGDLPAWIANEFNYTGYLFCRLGYMYVCIERGICNHYIQVFVTAKGERKYLGDGTGSFGILAFLPLEEQKAILKANFPHFKDHLLKSKEEVEEALRLSRQLGYAFGTGFKVQGTASVAIPIRLQGEVVGTIVVAGLYDDMWKAKQAHIVSRIQEVIKQRSDE